LRNRNEFWRINGPIGLEILPGIQGAPIIPSSSRMCDGRSLLTLCQRLSSQIDTFLERPPGSAPTDLLLMHRSLDIDIRVRLATSPDAWAAINALSDLHLDSLRREAAELRDRLSRLSGDLLRPSRECLHVVEQHTKVCDRMAVLRRSIDQLVRENEHPQPTEPGTRRRDVEQAELALTELRRVWAAAMAREQEEYDRMVVTVDGLSSDLRMLEMRLGRQPIEAAKTQTTRPVMRAPLAPLRPVEERRTIPVRVGPIWESDSEDDFTWTNNEAENSSDSELESVMSARGSSDSDAPSGPNVFDEEEEVTRVSEDSRENDQSGHPVSVPPAQPNGLRRSRNFHRGHSSELPIDIQPPTDHSSQGETVDPPTEDRLDATDSTQSQPDASEDTPEQSGACLQDRDVNQMSGELLGSENSVDADRDKDAQANAAAPPQDPKEAQASPRAMHRFTIQHSFVIVSHSPRKVRRT
jgi:hypothetical protein